MLYITLRQGTLQKKVSVHNIEDVEFDNDYYRLHFLREPFKAGKNIKLRHI